MKKLFLLTLVMLTVGGTAAFAQDNINLGWVGCRSAANDANAALNDVTAANFPCAANNSIRNLVAAVNTSAPYTNFQGASIQIDFITGGGATLPDWWDVGGKIADAGGCRAGGMARATIGTLSSCGNPYGVTGQQAGGEAFFLGANGPGTYRMVADHVVVGGNVFVAPGAGGYAAMAIAVNSLGTVDDLDGTVLCNGCSVPASFVLNHVDFAADGALRSFDSVANTGLRVCVGWMGGVGGGGTTCPGATPSKNATWGQVKALYR